jgi:hypothetical protein
MSARRRAVWGVVCALALAALLAPTPDAFVERWYSRRVFPPLQRVLTTISNAIPFAVFDVLWIGAIAVTVVLVRRQVIAHGWRTGALRSLGGLVRSAAVVYLVFLATWGLNYRRVSMFEKVRFDPDRITSASRLTLASWAEDEMNADYGRAHQAPESLDDLRVAFNDALRAMGGPGIVPGRPKPTLLGAYFHQASIAGMTDPFLLETLLAPDLLDVERPFVIAHEWAHLAGYADESEANFIAYLTCRRGDARARYSAALEMIFFTGLTRDPKRALTLGPRIDMFTIRQRYAHTSGMVRLAAKEGYDKYLKANRVERGIESYDAVVQLILGTEFDAHGNPRLR